MSAPLDVVEQLVEELDRAFVGPVRSLLGLDLADTVQQRIGQRAELLAGQLAGDDDHLAADTVIDVMSALWPSGVLDPDWWRTPVGRLCARSLGTDEAESVTQSVAAAMLGVTRGTVSQLMHRHTLDRHPDGGVLRASVLQRIAASAR